MARRGIAAGGFPQSRAGRQRPGVAWRGHRAGRLPPPEAVFLGRVEGGRHVWAVRAALQPIADPDIPAEAVDLRGLGRIMDDTSSQLVSSASALLNWHDNARFSALDGAPTKPARAGWSRVNPITGHEEFPVSTRR